MSLIDTTYFKGHLTVAQLGSSYVSNDLKLFIDWNEQEFLDSVLGVELARAMNAGLEEDTPETKWTELRDGILFQSTTNFPGYFVGWSPSPWYMNSQRQVQWCGFTPTEGKYSSPIAGYVYFRYMGDLATQATGVGIVKAKAGAADGGVDQGKRLKAWNQMCKDVFNLWLFLAAKGKDVYPDYDITKIEFRKFKPRNTHGL